MLSKLFGEPAIVRFFMYLLEPSTSNFLSLDIRRKCRLGVDQREVALNHAQRLGVVSLIDERDKGHGRKSNLYRVNKDSELFKALVAFDKQITSLIDSGTGERTQVAVVADLPMDVRETVSIDQSKGSKSGGDSGSIPSAPPIESVSGKGTDISKPGFLTGDQPRSLVDSPPPEKSRSNSIPPRETGCKDCGLPMKQHFDDGSCPPVNNKTAPAPILCPTCNGSGGIVVSGEDGPDSTVCTDCHGDGIAKEGVSACKHCGLPMAIHDGTDFCPPGTEEGGGRR